MNKRKHLASPEVLELSGIPATEGELVQCLGVNRAEFYSLFFKQLGKKPETPFLPYVSVAQVFSKILSKSTEFSDELNLNESERCLFQTRCTAHQKSIDACCRDNFPFSKTFNVFKDCLYTFALFSIVRNVSKVVNPPETPQTIELWEDVYREIVTFTPGGSASELNFAAAFAFETHFGAYSENVEHLKALHRMKPLSQVAVRVGNESLVYPVTAFFITAELGLPDLSGFSGLSPLGITDAKVPFDQYSGELLNKLTTPEFIVLYSTHDWRHLTLGFEYMGKTLTAFPPQYPALCNRKPFFVLDQADAFSKFLHREMATLCDTDRKAAELILFELVHEVDSMSSTKPRRASIPWPPAFADKLADRDGEGLLSDIYMKHAGKYAYPPEYTTLFVSILDENNPLRKAMKWVHRLSVEFMKA